MNSIQRYNFTNSGTDGDPEGEWVRFEDVQERVEHLKSQRDALLRWWNTGEAPPAPELFERLESMLCAVAFDFGATVAVSITGDEYPGDMFQLVTSASTTKASSQTV